jgi:translation initiation factor IF-1
MSNNVNNARMSKGKGLGRTAERAKNKNEELMKEVLKDGIDEDEMRFGVILKVFGNGRFEVHLTDGRITNASIRDLLSSKKGTPVSNGTIVLIHLPNWEKDALTKNTKPISYIEGVLDNDSHVPILKKRGELPEWMFGKKEFSGSSKPSEDGFEFVSAEAERALATEALAEAKEEDEEEDDEKENIVVSNSAAATVIDNSARAKARDIKIAKARSVKEFNVDDI